MNSVKFVWVYVLYVCTMCWWALFYGKIWGRVEYHKTCIFLDIKAFAIIKHCWKQIKKLKKEQNNTYLKRKTCFENGHIRSFFVVWKPISAIFSITFRPSTKTGVCWITEFTRFDKPKTMFRICFDNNKLEVKDLSMRMSLMYKLFLEYCSFHMNQIYSGW